MATQDVLIGSMEDQLSELYAERAILAKLGPLSAEQIVTMVGSLEDQLKALYQDVDPKRGADR